VPIAAAQRPAPRRQFCRGLLDKKSEAQTCNPATTNWQQESSDSGLDQGC
jgi:hypothetical protein